MEQTVAKKDIDVESLKRTQKEITTYSLNRESLLPDLQQRR